MSQYFPDEEGIKTWKKEIGGWRAAVSQYFPDEEGIKTIDDLLPHANPRVAVLP